MPEEELKRRPRESMLVSCVDYTIEYGEENAREVFQRAVEIFNYMREENAKQRAVDENV